MGRDQLLAEILKLSCAERNDLIQEVNALTAEEGGDDPDMTPELAAELERRLKLVEEDPERGSSWEEVSARLKARCRPGGAATRRPEADR